MLNKIILMGRLTHDPELRRTESGTAVCSFSIAVDRDFKSKNGEKETDFIDIVSWRATAEFVSKYFTKGRMAVVEGRLQIRDWTDKEGGKRRSAEVIADNVYFGDSKPKDGGEEDDVPAYTGAPDSFAVPDGFTPDFGGESGEMPFYRSCSLLYNCGDLRVTLSHNMIGSVPVRLIKKLSASLGDRIAFAISFCPFLSAGKTFHEYEDCSVSLLNP